MSAESSPVTLPCATSEAQGVPSDAILAFVHAAHERVGGLHAFTLVRHGHVIAQGAWAPYAADRRHMLFSLSKSFTSTAVGLAVSEGRLSVDDSVLSFFPEDVPAEPSENLRAMTVRHLLTMSVGHETDSTGALRDGHDGNWVEAFLAQPVVHEPGTRFLYNSGATYMLSAIVQKVTGETLLSYLQPRLFGPLGIEDATWESCPRGINTGGWGLSVTTEEIARFGQLYLQQGRWNDRPLVPQAWVEEATAKQISNGDDPQSDWAQGYGYQFWRCRHGAYRGDGAFGQYCVVMPEQDAVLAITSGVGDMQAILSLAWEHLLSAMEPSPLPESAAAMSLTRELARLEAPFPEGRATSPTAERVSGRMYAMEANESGVESLTVAFGEDGATLTTVCGQGEQKIEFGYRDWKRGVALLPGRGPEPVAAAGAWTDASTYEARVRFIETPFVLTTTLRFSGDDVTFGSRMNVGFGPTEGPEIVGHAAPNQTSGDRRGVHSG